MAFVAVGLADGAVLRGAGAVGAAAADQPVYAVARPGQDHRATRGGRAIATWLIVGGLYVLYALGYAWSALARASTTPGLRRRRGAMCALMLGVYPATAVDVFGYIAHGQLEACTTPIRSSSARRPTPPTRSSPYLAFPTSRRSTARSGRLSRRGSRAWRGPTCSRTSCSTSSSAALAQLAAALLILTDRAKTGRIRRLARASAFVFLWNPLLLWEMVGNAHNDGLMMLGGAARRLAVLVTDRNLLVLPALIAAARWSRCPSWSDRPVLFVAVWQRNRGHRHRRRFWLALLLAVIVYRPFWDGPRHLTALRRTDLFTASLGSVLRLALAPGVGSADRRRTSRAARLAGRLRAWSRSWRRCARAWPRPMPSVLRPGLLRRCSAALLLATTWFQAWYLVWPMALGAALPSARRHLEVALLSLGGLLQYFVFIYLWVIGVFPPEDSLALQLSALSGSSARPCSRSSSGVTLDGTPSPRRPFVQTDLAPSTRAARATTTPGSISTARSSATRTSDLAPMTHALHYGTGCFEGIRAYWNASQEQLYLLKGAAHYDSPAPLGEHPAPAAAALERRELVRPHRRDAAQQRGAHRHLHSAAGVHLGRRDRRPAARPAAELPDLHRAARRVHRPAKAAFAASPVAGDASRTRRSRREPRSPARTSTRRWPSPRRSRTATTRRSCSSMDGHVSEGSAENLFMLQRRRVRHPAGDRRHPRRHHARRHDRPDSRSELGLDVVERSIDRTELYACDELFLCGTGAQVSPVIEVDRRADRLGQSRRTHAAAAGDLLPRRARRGRRAIATG